MSKEQIFIKNGNNWFEFSKSKTGQLDYEGLWNNNALPNVDGYQEIASSAYFSPSWYIFLQEAVNNNSKVYVSPETDVSDADEFAFLTHVGPLLAAVQAEPYNPVDKNAISVLLENIDSKITGNPGLEKAGYVRAMAAKVIREAKPSKAAKQSLSITKT